MSALFVEIAVYEGKGSGLRSTRQIAEGEVIFTERPLFAQQLISNERVGVTCCCQCLSSFSSPLESLEGYVAPNLLKRIKHLPFEKQVYKIPQIVYCDTCYAMYCSEACKKVSSEEGHAFTCFPYDQEDPDHPFSKIKSSSLEMENHLPLLFMRMMAYCLQKETKTQTARQVWEKTFGAFCSHVEDVSEEVEQMYEEMTLHFRSLFQKFPQATEIIDNDFFKKTMDMLNVNQQLITPRSPFDVYWGNLSPEQENHPRTNQTLDPILQQLGENNVVQVEDVVGGGMFTLHHHLNHSCAPNSKVASIHSDSTLSIFALRDIEAGEEICFDYISAEGLDYNTRQDELFSRFYFKCVCPLCVSQE